MLVLFSSITIPQLKTMMLSPLSVYCAPSPQTYIGIWSPELMSPIGLLQAFMCCQYFEMDSCDICGKILCCIIQGNNWLGRSSGIGLQDIKTMSLVPNTHTQTNRPPFTYNTISVFIKFLKGNLYLLNWCLRAGVLHLIMKKKTCHQG